MPEPLISLQGVNKWYGSGAGRQQVLYDVNVDVKQGNLVSIIGTSGSGKSTLLNIIGGLDRQYSGDVHVLGHAYNKLTDGRLSRLRNRQIGFVFQAFNLLDHLTCWENVALPSFFGPRRRDELAHAAELLDRVGLKDKIHSRPGNLSGGQKQRVAIARSLFNDPTLLLCDEPTGNLDTNTGLQIIDLFSSLNKDDGITVLIVTHELRVSKVADRLIRIEDGKIVDTNLELPSDECTDASELPLVDRDAEAAPYTESRDSSTPAPVASEAKARA